PSSGRRCPWLPELGPGTLRPCRLRGRHPRGNRFARARAAREAAPARLPAAPGGWRRCRRGVQGWGPSRCAFHQSVLALLLGVEDVPGSEPRQPVLGPADGPAPDVPAAFVVLHRVDAPRIEREYLNPLVAEAAAGVVEIGIALYSKQHVIT